MTPTVTDIQKAACDHFGISMDDLLGFATSYDKARPRLIAMYLARELTGMSYPALGREFGGRDHTTIMCGCRRITRLLAHPGAAEAIWAVRSLIRATPPKLDREAELRKAWLSSITPRHMARV